MAEVGQRLCGRACQLSAVRTSQSRPVSTGGDPISVPVARASAVGPVRDGIMRKRHEDQFMSQFRAARHKVNSATGSERQTEELMSLCTPVHHQSHQTQTSPPAQKSSPRMTVWTRRDVSIHSAPFRNPHLRSFCTVILNRRPSCGWRCLKVNAVAPAASKNYSWSSDDPPLLHLSRTAYYDILKVSPTATQSQIKTAYYKQSFIYHPDRNQSSKEATLRFSDISEAYTVLGNISLRRKYDLGILSQSDVQSAGKPSSKEASSKSKGTPHQQQKTWRFSQPGGKPIFDFDAFYQAHYGEQLERERRTRARKQQMEEMQKNQQSRWIKEKRMELALTVVLAMGGMIFISLNST